MIKIAICEDDIIHLNNIASIIDEFIGSNNIPIIYTKFQSSLDFLNYIDGNNPFDIIFLDIIMPVFNGIEVANEIRSFDQYTRIIFLTNSSEFAVESYVVNAYHYMLKPINKELFIQLLYKLIREIKQYHCDSLVISSKSSIYRILLSSIKYCEVIGKHIFYHLIDGSTIDTPGTFYSVSNTLLKHPFFIKSHRSFIVNMDYIYSINNKEILMDNMCKIPISRGNFNEVKDRYLSYCFNKYNVL